jgi:hypothetical protein
LPSANALGIRHPLAYGILGIGGLWLAFLLFGVYPTIAHVLAAFTIPARARLSGEEFIIRSRALLEKFQEELEPSGSTLANKNVETGDVGSMPCADRSGAASLLSHSVDEVAHLDRAQGRPTALLVPLPAGLIWYPPSLDSLNNALSTLPRTGGDG